MSVTSSVIPQDLANALAALRTRPPLVQCLTNIVAAEWTANVLLAAGAIPAMIDNPHEADEFVALAGSVLVNLGTPYDDTAIAMYRTATTAHLKKTPWVLDPVAVGALRWRTELARQLLSEAVLLATQHKTVVAVSGATDHITDGRRIVRIKNGHLWLTRVTGVGCALGALMAAFAAVEPDAVVAAATATAMLTVAADAAATQARGPGSFATALLDELALIEPDALAKRVRIN